MQSRDFCFWLQGFFELSAKSNAGCALSVHQVNLIRSHLGLVFAHEIDPAMGDESHQEKLNDLHKPSAFGGKLPDGTILRC